AFAFAGDAALQQIFDDDAELRIVKAFAEGVIEFYAKTAVDFIELLFGETNHLLPDGGVFLVTSLELDQFLFGFFKTRGIGVAFGVDDFVEAFEFGDGVLFERGAIEDLFPAEEQLAELRAPIADVVINDDVVAEQAESALKRVADAGRADVADVHG